MKQINSSEVNVYIENGFKEETRYTKGSDGIRTYTVLTKKNDFGTRIKNFFRALAKTLFSFGTALKDQKTLDLWNSAFSKRTVVEIIPTEKPEEVPTEPVEPIKIEEPKPTKEEPLEEPKPLTVIEPLKAPSQPKAPARMVNYRGPTPSLLDLCRQVAAQNPNLKPALLPREVANKLLTTISKENILNPSALNSVSNADELSLSINMNPAKFRQILESCPNLTSFNFNSFANCTLEDFKVNVALLLKFKEKQPTLTVCIDSSAFDETIFYKFFVIFGTDRSFLRALTPEAKNLFFIDLFKAYLKFSTGTQNLCDHVINSFSNEEIDSLASAILSKPRISDFATLFATFIDISPYRETIVNVLFKQEDVLTVLEKLFTDEKRLYSLKPSWLTNSTKFLGAAFSKLSDAQFENLTKIVFKSTPKDESIKDESIKLLTRFLCYSVIKCNADAVLKRIPMVLKELDEEKVIPLIIKSLKAETYEYYEPPRAELNFYLVWNSMQQQDNRYELLKTTLAKFSALDNREGENLVFLRLLAEKCAPNHCDGILSALTKDNYKKGNYSELISLFLNTILGRKGNEELIEKAFSAYWKNYTELSGRQLPGTLALVLPFIQSKEHLTIILKAIPDELDDENRKKICQVIILGSHEYGYPEYKCRLSEQEIDDVFHSLHADSKLLAHFKSFRPGVSQSKI